MLIKESIAIDLKQYDHVNIFILVEIV